MFWTGRELVTARSASVERPEEVTLDPVGYERLRPGPGQSRLEVIASQRTRLQRAMIELAASDGVDGVTVRKLTKLAGVSTGAFYARFAGTDDCLLAAYGAFMAGLVGRMTSTRSLELEPADQICATLRGLEAALSADPDAARFSLIQIYDGGPAALAAIAREERRLQVALRGCLDRRGSRVPTTMPAAILAAALHCFRMQLIEGVTGDEEASIDELVEWAHDMVDGAEAIAPSSFRAEVAAQPASDRADLEPRGRHEEDVILAAVLRLATPDGFFGLSPGKISSAAGLPAARLRRHFASLTDVYLAAVRHTCRSFFAELTAGGDHGEAERVSLRLALRQAWRRAVSNPAGARLTFQGIVEPGVAGLTCREALISELAVACDPGSTWEGNRPARVRAEARAAAIWATLERASPAR